MSKVENTGAEAVDEPVTRALRSARRALLWAGLNRHPGSEDERPRTPPVPEQPQGENPEPRDSR